MTEHICDQIKAKIERLIWMVGVNIVLNVAVLVLLPC